MLLAARNLQFEKAAYFRDEIEKLHATDKGIVKRIGKGKG